MATVVKTLTPFSPAEVDALAIEYRAIDAQIDEIEKNSSQQLQPLLSRRGELQTLFRSAVRQFGSAHAEKSKLLHGMKFEIMASFGMSSSIDSAAVNIFRLALVKAKLTRLLKKIFDRTERWDLRPDAAEVIRSTQLPPKLHVLYSQCTVTKERTPTLVVRPKS
jgi:hypothetical protein